MGIIKRNTMTLADIDKLITENPELTAKEFWPLVREIEQEIEDIERTNPYNHKTYERYKKQVNKFTSQGTACFVGCEG